MEVVRAGVIQYVSPKVIIVSKANSLYLSYDSGKNWELWCTLPISVSDRILSMHRWLSRPFRKEINHVVKVTDQIFACFGFGEIFLIELGTGKLKSIGAIEGSRPLKVASVEDNLIYGVYSLNHQRRPIKLLSYSLGDDEWTVDYVFDDIRHIHGVFWDDFTSKLWITTGDLDHESKILTLDKSGDLEVIASGSQQIRVVDLLFTTTDVYFATDAPEEINFICRLDREKRDAEKLCRVGGPVFWGRNDGNWLFFSTVVESSTVNREDAVELWGSNDGGNKWIKIKEFKKDIFHNLYFQYGQIKFPSGIGDDKNLWFSPYSTEYDHKVLKMRLNTIVKHNS